MIHSYETMTNLGISARHGKPVYQCPECGAKIVDMFGAIGGECRGPRAPKPEPLDCIHRLEKVGTVPCGTCSQTNKPLVAAVYLCRADGGRICTLRDVGRGPEQRIGDAFPVVCATCELRTPPTKE